MKKRTLPMLKVARLLTASFNPSIWVSGQCAEFAVALQEIMGGEFFVIRGFYFNDDEEDMDFESGHVVVSLDGGETGLDAFGKNPMEKIIAASGFSTQVEILKVQADAVSMQELEWEMSPDPGAVQEAKTLIPTLMEKGYFN